MFARMVARRGGWAVARAGGLGAFAASCEPPRVIVVTSTVDGADGWLRAAVNPAMPAALRDRAELAATSEPSR